MEQLLITKQAVLPITNIDYVELIKSNYANYFGSSATNDDSALIDIIENVIILGDLTNNLGI